MPAAPDFPPAPDKVAIRRALISVSDKTGLIEAATALSALGVELVSTGGTRAAIAHRLLARGWDPGTPAAVVRAAGTPRATRWLGTLATVGALPLPGDDDAPGMLVFGDVVALAAELQPIFGERSTDEVPGADAARGTGGGY